MTSIRYEDFDNRVLRPSRWSKLAIAPTTDTTETRTSIGSAESADVVRELEQCRMTPGPMASTVPDTSQPSTNGGLPTNAPLFRFITSTGFTLAACPRTRISPMPGLGKGRVTRLG